MRRLKGLPAVGRLPAARRSQSTLCSVSTCLQPPRCIPISGGEGSVAPAVAAAAAQVKGKCNAISIDKCQKTGVVFEDVIASCELVNCSSVQVRPVMALYIDVGYDDHSPRQITIHGDAYTLGLRGCTRCASTHTPAGPA